MKCIAASGKIVQTEWMRSSHIRKEILLYEDEYVVMPNHFHGIVWIISPERDELLQSSESFGSIPGDAHNPSTLIPKSLGSFITGFKSSVTRRARDELGIGDIWQRNYFDHIVRNETDFKHIWEYIDNNPRKWSEGRFYFSTYPPFSSW
jgi:REP element-mobilizing transposase RayT